MTINRAIPPNLSHWRAQARNGMVPSAYFWQRLIDFQNHLTAYGTAREVYSKSWELGQNAAVSTTGTVSVGRFRFRTSRSASTLTFFVVAGPAFHPTWNEITSARMDIDVTISGGATSTLTFHDGGNANTSGQDVPNDWGESLQSLGVTASTVYEVNIKTVGYYRPLAVIAFEESSQTLSESTNYYNTMAPVAGFPIYDADRQQILASLSNMYRQGGITYHWSLEGGTARTRTTATNASMYDGTTTGTPTAGSSNGFYFDPRYHRTASRTTVPFEWGVYASMAAGSGSVRIIDTAGTTYGSITINSATPQWWTATFSIAESAALYLVPQMAGDGINALSVYAASIIEYESGP